LHRTELTDDLLSRSAPDKEASQETASSARIRVEYAPAGPGSILPDGLLAAVRFGAATTAAPAQSSPQPLCIDVRLEPLLPATYAECWWASGPVAQGRIGSIRYASDTQHLFAISEVDERECDVCAAAEIIYAEMRRFQQRSGFPHLLRIWNYIDAINDGAGDQERYRQFCVGRVRGLGDATGENYPAATAIGHQHTTQRLQVYWLAGRTPGTYIENPRQVSAYHYPRAHGPVSPTFARATLTRDGTLLISGTASIVGHLSKHVGDPLAQLDETLRNLAILGAPVQHSGVDCKAQPENSLLKVYVRDAKNIDAVVERVRAAFPRSPALFLAADICRSELLLEIELLRLPSDPATNVGL
jgi:chorismate lyase/3-hydroxybenzoate synthase